MFAATHLLPRLMGQSINDMEHDNVLNITLDELLIR
jgi:hypothetical protein